jgi:hypothetical protein
VIARTLVGYGTLQLNRALTSAGTRPFQQPIDTVEHCQRRLFSGNPLNCGVTNDADDANCALSDYWSVSSTQVLLSCLEWVEIAQRRSYWLSPPTAPKIARAGTAGNRKRG